MVRHVILWKLKEELSAEEKAKVKREAKEHLEGLVGIVPGLREMHIHIEGLPSSNMDMMLDALLDDAASLKGYAVNPIPMSGHTRWCVPAWTTRSDSQTVDVHAATWLPFS